MVLLVLFAVLFSLAPALATPASAGVGNDIGDNGGSDSNGGIGSVTYKCVNGEGVHTVNGVSKFVRYRAPWPGCKWTGRGWVTDTTWRTHGEDAICHVGFEVYRFYSLGGSYHNPAEPHAWTRSTISYPDWCRPQPISVFYPNPEDSASRHVGTPWVVARGNNKFSGSYLQGWTRTSSGTYGTDNLVSASRNVCDTLMAGKPGRPSDPMPQFLRDASGVKGSKYDTTAGSQVRQDLLATYSSWVGSAGWQAALTVINAANTAPLNPALKGDDIRYGDGKSCSSDMDFATLDAPGSPHIFYGTCYVPIQARATVFYNSRNPSHKEYGYYTSNAGRGGLRYSKEYQGSTGAAAPSWRDKMAAIIAGSPGPGVAYTGAKNRQNLGSIDDRRAAAQQVRDTARCIESVASSYTSQGGEAKPIPAAEARLTLTMPDVFQTGWGMAGGANTVSVTSALMCDDPATSTKALVTCDSLLKLKPQQEPTLASLHFGAEMTGVNGYTGPTCSAGSAGCDFELKGYEELLSSVKTGPPLPVNRRGDQRYVDQDVIFKDPMFYSPVQRDATPAAPMENPKLDAEQVEVRVNGGNGGDLPTASYFEPLVGKMVYTHRYSIPTGGAPTPPKVKRYTIDILEYQLKNVPVVVRDAKGAELGRFENGKLVKGSSFWLKDAIGASGMTN